MTTVSYKKTRRYDESLEQMSFMKELMLRDRHAWHSTWWTPNERKTTIQQGVRQKAMGKKPGVPDIFMAIAKKGFHGLFIEMKIKGLKQHGGVTPSQKERMNLLVENGYMCQVCYGADDAMACVIEYLR
jgi:hypothetical protein